MQSLPPALAGLAQYRQFLAYRLEPSNKRPGKMDKKPISVQTGHVCKHTDPRHWCSFQEAAAFVAAGWADGIGFELTANDPFWFLDIDGALRDGQWHPLAQNLLNATAGAAIEVSQSGTGLHVIGTGTPPPHRSKPSKAIKAELPIDLEFYSVDRFVALTGRQTSGDVNHDCTVVLPELVNSFFARDGEAEAEWSEWTDEPVAGWDGHIDDGQLLDHACRQTHAASQAFGADARASFRDLFEANEEVLAQVYPDSDRAYDASRADAALAQHLAFWTGNDCERMERLMRRSALARDKWDNHATYLYMTIMGACRNQNEFHQQKRAPEQPEPVEPAADVMGNEDGPELLTSHQYLAGPQQIEHFKGCVYVREEHKALIPDGSLLKPEQFKATYGGYVFLLDPDGTKTSRNAWEVFTESQAVRFPKVHRTMFRPDLPPGALFRFDGQRRVNSYFPVPVEHKEGDPEPFLQHLRLLLPEPRDREILLAYMAACVQHKGTKFQWWPLVQGVEGNGKTLLSRCVAHAVGMPHVASPRAEEISNKFNSWIKDKLFVYVEDVYYPDHKREVIEALKPIVTNDWLPVEPKGVDQTLEYVVANGILNSNHRDAIRKTRNDRRFTVFFTNQQAEGDLARDGMAGDYFPRLYDWLKKQNGYAVVANYLATYPIPDALNPATSCHRAPETSTTEQAIAESLGAVEQEVMEAIAQGRPGFAGGWVSSMALDRLLEQMRAGRSVPPRKRREMMQQLGYDWHPALHNGRVNNTVPLDGGKPRLFIRDGHIHRNLTSAAEVARYYQDAQQPETPEWVDKGVNNS